MGLETVGRWCRCAPQEAERAEKDRKRAEEKADRDRKKQELARTKEELRLRVLQEREEKKLQVQAEKDRRAQERKDKLSERRKCATPCAGSRQTSVSGSPYRMLLQASRLCQGCRGSYAESRWYCAGKRRCSRRCRLKRSRRRACGRGTGALAPRTTWTWSGRRSSQPSRRQGEHRALGVGPDRPLATVCIDLTLLQEVLGGSCRSGVHNSLLDGLNFVRAQVCVWHGGRWPQGACAAPAARVPAAGPGLPAGVPPGAGRPAGRGPALRLELPAQLWGCAGRVVGHGAAAAPGAGGRRAQPAAGRAPHRHAAYRAGGHGGGPRHRSHAGALPSLLPPPPPP